MPPLTAYPGLLAAFSLKYSVPGRSYRLVNVVLTQGCHWLYRDHHQLPSIQQLQLSELTMQSSTLGQAPSQAFQSNKRRKLVPTIDPDMIEPLNRFSDMLADMNSDDPVIRSRAAEQLTVLSPLMQQLAFAKNVAGVHYAARDFKTLGVACTILEITHNPMDLWNRPDIDNSPSATLSP